MTEAGKAFCYGDAVNTDVIIPARYLNSADPAVLAAHCMEDIDAEFVKNVQKGDFIAAGDNFGCGSSREHAPLAIQACGISCVIAKSFARIFYRNAINIGLPLMVCPDADRIAAGDILQAEWENGCIHNLTKHETYKAEALPLFAQNIIKDGGLLASLKNAHGKTNRIIGG